MSCHDVVDKKQAIMKIGSFSFPFMLYFFFLFTIVVYHSLYAILFHKEAFFYNSSLLSPRSKKKTWNQQLKGTFCYIVFAFRFSNARLVREARCSGNDISLLHVSLYNKLTKAKPSNNRFPKTGETIEK